MSAPVDGWPALERTDPEVAVLVAAEYVRRDRVLSLVASENRASPSVLATLGTALNDKYCDGVVGDRLYPGCEVVDQIEALAARRGSALLGADHVNVQPHAGTQANEAAFAALLLPGDRLLTLEPRDGGHPSHGAAGTAAARSYGVHFYGLGPDGRLDLDRVAARARVVRPQLLVAGGSAYPRALEVEAFRAIADDVGARLLVDAAHVVGLVAAGRHPALFPAADVVTFTTHKTLRGPRGGAIACRAEHADAVDRAVHPGVQGGSLPHVVAAKAVAFLEASTGAFADHINDVLATAAGLASHLAEGGATLSSGGTDTHLVVADVHADAGRMLRDRLEAAGLLVTVRPVPGSGDARASAVRVGTPAAVSAGIGPADAPTIARWLLDVATRRRQAGDVRAEVERLVADRSPAVAVGRTLRAS